MRHALAAAALLLAACDGPLLYVELEIPEIRVTLPSQSFPASDASIPDAWCDPTGQTFPPCLAVGLDYDLGAEVPIFEEENVTYDLRLTDVAVSLAATEVGKDLAGVKLLRVRVLQDPLDPASGVVVAAYARADGAAPASIAVTGNANVDLGPYLRTGLLPLRFELVVDQPTPAFLADVEAAFSVSAELDYGAFL